MLLALIVVGAWGARYAYLVHAESTPHFEWADPDGYTRQARALVGEDGRWRWSWEAVHYRWNKRVWALPPGYPFWLSFFALAPQSFPRNAGYMHPVLGAVLVVALFWMGTSIHSRRAGLIAAFIGAIWVPNATGASGFFQEQLYLPLLALAFAATVDAWSRDSRGPLFAVGGALFALASLTRAMPFYFVPIAAATIVLGSAPWRLGLRRALWLAGGFAIIVVPYITALSLAHNQLILIDNHGSIEMDKIASMRTVRTPGVADTVRLLANQITANPPRFVEEKVDLLRGMFHVQGGRWLETYGASSSGTSAMIRKAMAHIGIDLTFITTALLAPLGVVLARRRRQASLIAIWIPVVIGLSLIAKYAGARIRSPFEPHMIVLASVVLAGTWERTSRARLASAAAVSLIVAVLLVPQIPRTLKAHAQYGLGDWQSDARQSTASADGASGFNVLAQDGKVRFELALTEDRQEGGQPVIVTIDGRRITNVAVSTTPRPMEFDVTDTGLHYVELTPLAHPTGRSPAYTITVPR